MRWRSQCRAAKIDHGQRHSMLVIALASQKGGSGKTTLSGHLAVEAEKAGAGPVALIDTDPQGSLAAWWNVRAEKTPAFAKVGVFDLQSALQRLERSGIKLVIIDTPPAITDAISHVISLADLIVVPCRPSPHDLRSVGATADLADRHQKALIFVVNAATPRARITGEAAVALSQHGTVAPITIHHRVDFAASMVDGRTVGEVVPGSASAKEVGQLWVYIQDRLARLVKDPTLAPEDRPEYSITALSPGVEETEEVMESPLVAEDLPALNARLSEAFESEPMVETPAGEPSESKALVPYHEPDPPPPEEPAALPEPEVQPPPTERKLVRSRPTLFGGANRQTNTFGRRNY
jgi:chromosome partitioning protein